MSTTKSTETAGKQPGFEEALGRLEKIVEEMEKGELSLDQMIGRFEEGQKLLKLCTKTLNEVEQKIEKLVKRGDDVIAQPLDEATPPDAVPSGPPEPDFGDDELF